MFIWTQRGGATRQVCVELCSARSGSPAAAGLIWPVCAPEFSKKVMCSLEPRKHMSMLNLGEPINLYLWDSKSLASFGV